MGDVNFYLKKPVKGAGKSLIFLKFKYNRNNALVYPFGQSINPSNWNAEKQRVKSNRQTTGDGQNSLNDLLDNLAKLTKTAYNNELKNGVPEPGKLRKHLDDFFLPILKVSEFGTGFNCQAFCSTFLIAPLS